MTIKDISRESGYSIGTVSRVLNNSPNVSQKAYNAIMAVVEKNHFLVNSNAKQLKKQGLRSIAVIVKGSKNMLFSSILESLQDIISKEEYLCLIYYIDEKDNEVDTALQILKDKQPKGFIFLGSHMENFQKGFKYLGCPSVIATNSAKELKFEQLASVCINDRAAAMAAVCELIKLGHKDIAVLGGDYEHSDPSKSRLLGAGDAFEKYNIGFDKERLYQGTSFSIDGGYKAMKELLQKNSKLSAVFAMADVMAVGAIRAIVESKRSVPEDISVVGFDGIELGRYLNPRLSTIKQPDNDIARLSFELLEELFEGKKARHIESSYKFIKGESMAEYEESVF